MLCTHPKLILAKMLPRRTFLGRSPSQASVSQKLPERSLVASVIASLH